MIDLFDIMKLVFYVVFSLLFIYGGYACFVDVIDWLRKR